MWASTTDLAKHHIRAIAYQQKWVTGNAETIIGNVANKPMPGCQWYQRGPFGKRIAPGNPDFAEMSPLAAFVHVMPLEQLDLMLELTNKRLAAKAKKELTRQELLRWIGVCMLIASINTSSGRAAALPPSTSPPMTWVGARGISCNCFDDIYMLAGGLVNHPSSQRACCWSGIIGC